MKKLFALILSILLLSGCTSPAVYEGPTKSAWVLTEQVTTYYVDGYSSGEPQRIIFAYDTFGNRIRSFSYLDGELDSERRYTYDDRGNVTSLVVWDHSGLISWPRSRTTYTYDAQNRPLTTTYHNALGIRTGQDTYAYDDEAGTVTWDGTHDTQIKWLNENGDPLRTLTNSEAGVGALETVCEYDDLGRCIRSTTLLDGALCSTSEMVYDDQGRILRQTICDADGTVISRRTCQYDEHTVTTYEMDGAKTVETFRPDRQPEKREQFDKLDRLTHMTKYTYQEIQVPADREE